MTAEFYAQVPSKSPEQIENLKNAFKCLLNGWEMKHIMITLSSWHLKTNHKCFIYTSSNTQFNLTRENKQFTYAILIHSINWCSNEIIDGSFETNNFQKNRKIITGIFRRIQVPNNLYPSFPPTINLSNLMYEYETHQPFSLVYLVYFQLPTFFITNTIPYLWEVPNTLCTNDELRMTIKGEKIIDPSLKPANS